MSQASTDNLTKRFAPARFAASTTRISAAAWSSQTGKHKNRIDSCERRIQTFARNHIDVHWLNSRHTRRSGVITGADGVTVGSEQLHNFAADCAARARHEDCLFIHVFRSRCLAGALFVVVSSGSLFLLGVSNYL